MVLSHRNLIAGAESVSTYLENSADDVLLAALPLSFDAGFSQLTTSFAVGAHVVLTNYLLPGDIPRLCARHRVTGLTCVPPLWIQIAEQNWPDDARASLRYFANTGGRMPKPVLDRLREVFPTAKPYLMYGLTEAFRSTYLDPAQIDQRPGSIGKAIPGAEILVVRPDGSTCDPGEEGELVHRGPHVALGYWNDPARTAERFRPVPGRDEPWRTAELAVFSGDTVVTDADGYLYFVGRRDDMIKTSGYRVSPTEIEEAAYATGLVRDAVALGVEDAALGERVLLVVAPTAEDVTTDALLEAMRSGLPLYMVPGSVVDPCGDPPLAQREIRPGGTARGACHVNLRPVIAAFGIADGQLAVGGMPLDRLTARVGLDAVFRLRPTLAERARRGAARDTAVGDTSELRGQGQPDAGGRATPRRLGRRAGCRVDTRDARPLWTLRCPRTGSASPDRARPTRRSRRRSRRA